MKLFLLFLTSLFLLNTIDAQPVIPNLVANWKLNGNINDAGGNGINGTNNGATATTNKAGQANAAMNFSNTSPSVTVVNQYASYPSTALLNFTGSQNFTVSLLVNANGPLTRGMGLFDYSLNYFGYGIYLWQPTTTPTIQFNYKNGSLAGGSFPLGTWVHITAVRNNGTLSLYFNGNLISSGPEGTMSPGYPAPGVFGALLAFGFSSNNLYNGLNGKLDEVSIYNRALSNAEIASLASFLLPLKLGDFSAVKKSTGTVLYWQTLSETNTKRFQIERSTDGSNFTTIGEVQAAGNSSQPVNYQFTDASTQNITVFYRLKMMDLDGTATLSRIVTVNHNRYAGQLKVYPNPVIDQVQFQWQGQEGKQVQVEILDLAGRIRLTRTLQQRDGLQTFSLPLTGFNSGLYTLRIRDAAGQQSTVFLKK